MNPIRIKRERHKGWKMPPNTVYVGRPSSWGNPFKGENAYENFLEMINQALENGTKLGIYTIEKGTENKPPLLGMYPLNGIERLRGKNLACWCPLDKPCHADILLKIANE